MKAPPAGWPRMTASVFYDNPLAAIDWLVKAFGFELRLKVEHDGALQYSELCYGEALLSCSNATGQEPWQSMYRSPQANGGITQALGFHVDDVDAHHARALAAGARIVRDLRTTDYGDDYWVDRTYGALDLEGHLWWFMQRIRTGRAREA